LHALSKHLNIGSAILSLISQVIQCLIILVLDRIAQVFEYFCVLTEPVGVVEVVEALRWLDTVPSAKVLVRIV